MRKKGTSMFETIGALFVFFMLIALGLILYARFKAQAMQTDSLTMAEANVDKTYKRAITLPEITCSTNTVVAEQCIDTRKLHSFLNLLAAQPSIKTSYLYDRFKNAQISVRQVFPEGLTYLIYSQVPKDWENNRTLWVPVTMQDVTNGKNAFGVMIVETYS